MNIGLSLLSGVLLAACAPQAATQQNHSPAKSAEAPTLIETTVKRPQDPTASLPELSEISPRAALQLIQHTPNDVKTLTSEEACHIERGPKTPPPPPLKLAGKSADGTHTLYVDDGYMGGDHSVFDEVSAAIDGKGNQAMIVTETQSILIKSKTQYGISFNYRGGKLSCHVGYPAPARPAVFGHLTHGVHGLDLTDSSSNLQVKGRTRGDCLTLVDEANVPFLAAFPAPLDAGVIYRLIRAPFGDELPYDELHWLHANASSVKGVKVSLAAPVPDCGHISHAILLADTPDVSLAGIRFPSHQ